MDTIPLPDGVNHVVTFAEYARVGGELDAARLERDRLAAENAELKVEISETLVGCNRVAQSLMTELTAANATLDALRELFPPLMAIGRAHRLYVNDAIRATHILNPQPKETTHDDE